MWGFPYAPASMRRVWTLLAIVGAAAAAGCGGDEGSDSDRVTKVAEDYLSSFAAGNGVRACAEMTKQAQAAAVSAVTAAFPESAELSCAQAVKELSQDVAPESKRAMLNPEVVKVDVSGDRAQARLKGLGQPLRLERVEDDWKVARGISE